MKKLAVLLIVIMLGYSGKIKSADFNITDVHKAIAQENKWLNTSRPITADDLKGRIILLDFWTFCCINCMHVIPDLQYLEHKFGDSLTVIGVHSAKFANEKDTENIRSAILRYKIEHPVVNDSEFRIWRRFGVHAWPSLVLINPDGQIEEVYSGEGHREALENEISNLTGKYKNRLNNSGLPIALEKEKTPKSYLNFPGKIAVQESGNGGNTIYISDSGNNRILIVEDNGNVVAQIGSGNKGLKDGAFGEAEFNDPQGLLYKDGLLYVADKNNHAIREIDLANNIVTTVAGTGKQGFERRVIGADALKTNLASPWDLELFPDNNHITIAMAGTHQLWSYDIKNRTVSVIAGNGRESIDDGVYPYNSLSQPSGLSAYNGKLYFVDSETSSLRVLERGKISTLIGTGLFDFGFEEGKQGKALLQHPLGVYADDTGVYIADSYNHSVRKYDPKTATLSNFSGDGKRGGGGKSVKSAQYNEPNDIIKIGDKFYVADTNNNSIKIIDVKKNTVNEFTITESIQDNENDELPNLTSEAPPKIIPEELEIRMNLKAGWKINADAPSWMRIIKDDGKTRKVVIAEYTKNDIINCVLKTPELETGRSYILRGTFYYCEDKESSLCLIKSYDWTFTPSSEYKDKIMNINLN